VNPEPADVLAQVWQLWHISLQARRLLAGASHVETVERGAAVIVEGEFGTDAFVVIDGRFEVRIGGPRGPLPVAALGAYELFGEVAAATRARRSASVVALTPATVLRIDGEQLQRALDAEPEVRAELAAAAQHMAAGRFIKAATPFSDLHGEALTTLAERITVRPVVAGEVVMRRGEPGDTCYLVHTGVLDVIDDADGAERVLATLQPGMLCGEGALLTGAPRNATVRATVDGELYAIARDDLRYAMTSERAVAERLVELLQARSRPRRRNGVEVHEHRSPDGGVFATLKDPERSEYFRLSEHGLFLWQRLDGRHTVRDLTMDLFREKKLLAPDIVMEILRYLAASEFIEIAHVETPTVIERNRERFARSMRGALERSFTFAGCDPVFSAVYEGGMRFFYTRAGAVVVAAIVLAGFAAFLATSARASGSLLHGPTFARAAIALVPLAALAVVLHELGHGMAAKAAGAWVDRVGIGWFWLRPVVFVDTSDAWLSTRAQRMLVDAGGILVNLVLAGIAGIIAFAATERTAQTIAFVFALWSYIGILRNLNPLLEYDGYYLLMDWLDRPNLRGKSLAWLGTSLPAALRDRRRFRGHVVDVWYGIGSICYIVVATCWLIFAYRVTLEGWVARVVPPAYAYAITEGIAVVIASSAIIQLIADVRRETATARGHARVGQPST
jgi:CRP-like cAMP-binding protein